MSKEVGYWTQKGKNAIKSSAAATTTQAILDFSTIKKVLITTNK
jgi:hypothetical protein